MPELAGGQNGPNQLSPREKFEAFSRRLERELDGQSPGRLLAMSEGFQVAAEALEEIEECLSPELAWAIGEMLETRARIMQGIR